MAMPPTCHESGHVRSERPTAQSGQSDHPLSTCSGDGTCSPMVHLQNIERCHSYTVGLYSAGAYRWLLHLGMLDAVYAVIWT